MDDLEALEWGDEVLALLKSTSEEPDCLDAPATVASPHRTPMSDDSVREPGVRLERPEPNPPEPEPFPQPPPSPFPQPFPGPFPDPLPEPYPEGRHKPGAPPRRVPEREFCDCGLRKGVHAPGGEVQMHASNLILTRSGRGPTTGCYVTRSLYG
jgi:hypothetical protein